MPTLTPAKTQLLRYLAELGLASLPQLARLACPSHKSARRHLRSLFDAGLVEVVPASRILLAGPEMPNDASLLFGSAPNLYTLTRAGVRLLVDLGVEVPSPTHRYGPKNSLFLGHELAVRDVRVWLEVTAREYRGHRLETWKDGPNASLDPDRSEVHRLAEPDAWFAYRFDRKVLVGLLEYDRGTERGTVRWKAKVAGYQALFAGTRLTAVTTYQNARVIVITPNTRRRDALANFLATDAPTELASRFWLASRSVLDQPDLMQPVWRHSGSGLLRPLVPKELLDAS